MLYQIHTTPILDAFSQNSDGCPFCAIAEKMSEKFTQRYLNEAVMSPSQRGKVNKTGFCRTHFDMLLKGDNSLGVALQESTRLDYLMSLIKKPSNSKEKKKQLDALLPESFSCVICQELHHIMSVYYSTAAQMYFYQEEFPAVLKNSKGFCIYHFTKLLEHSNYARNKEQQYIDDLYTVEKTGLKKLRNDLEKFCNKFHYQKTDMPWGDFKTAPKDAAKILTKQY